MNYPNLKRFLRLLKRTFTEPLYVYQQIKPRFLYKLNKFLIPYLDGRSIHLSGVSLFLTWRCNLKCKMCNLWGEYGVSLLENKKELGFSEYKKILDEISIFSPEVILTGGEPLLHKEWDKIVEYLRFKKFRNIVLLTNGTLLEKNAEKIVTLVDTINVSLDGPPELHDKIRGKSGIFQEIVEGIKKILKIKEIKNSKIPYINIAYTISDLNYFYLKEFLKYFENLNLPINTIIFQHLEFIGEDGLNKTEKIYKNYNMKTSIWKGFNYKIEKINIDALIKEIREIKNTNYKNIYPVFFPDFNEEELRKYYLFPSEFPQKNPEGCLGPYLEALITPYGDLWICPDYVIGNLKEESFENLWNSEKAKNFRKKLLEGPMFPVCRCCGCFYVR
jgi:MoaA/NifB/PqqE/SkfB family radical SAM enzyme